MDPNKAHIMKTHFLFKHLASQPLHGQSLGNGFIWMLSCSDTQSLYSIFALTQSVFMPAVVTLMPQGTKFVCVCVRAVVQVCIGVLACMWGVSLYLTCLTSEQSWLARRVLCGGVIQGSLKWHWAIVQHLWPHDIPGCLWWLLFPGFPAHIWLRWSLEAML